MCDTFVALRSRTGDGSVLFAKNSDRCPNEPHEIIRTYPVDYPEDSYVECTYLAIPQALHTNACLLLKPSWIWGCEMGANEFGLHIGNEAVFTKEPVAHDDALTGMDIVRLALERTQTAREAADLIITLISKYDQGGNCAFDGEFYYHNSFLIADPVEAIVLETAGEYWALKYVDDEYAISNCLSIERDYDEIHAGAIYHAMENKWCRSEAEFGFASCYCDEFKTRVGKGRERRASVMEQLSRLERVTLRDMTDILRSHNEKSRPFTRGSGADVCMHAGARIKASHTTGSLVSKISYDFSTELLTGMSTPCLAIFKPYWMQAKNTQLVFPMYAARASRECWIWREKLHRLVLSGKLSGDAIQKYIDERDTLEARFFAQAETAHVSRSSDATLANVAKRAVDDEVALIGETIRQAEESNERGARGGLLHNIYWNIQNRKLGRRRTGER